MQTIVIVDDDRPIAEALAELLQTAGRELVLCGDLESAQLAIERAAPACIVSDVRLTGPFRYEGLDFIAHIKRYAPATRIILMSGANTAALEREALARGADAVLTKPFGIDELIALLPDDALTTEPAAVVRIPSIDDVIAGGLVPHFQPIVDLSTEAVRGYESLARYRGEFFSNPAILFDYAERKERLADLELACLDASFEHGRRLAASARLFLNVHPAVIGTDRIGPALTAAAAAAKVSPAQVVLEITEQASLGNSATVLRQCDDLRARGFSFALDDMGMAYSHLPHIEKIRPVYLKVSQEFGTDFEKSATRTKIVRNVLSLAHDFGCELILEGIESAETKHAARELGIPLGQGYFFHRPAPAERFAISTADSESPPSAA